MGDVSVEEVHTKLCDAVFESTARGYNNFCGRDVERYPGRDEARSSSRTTRADTSVQQRHPRVPFFFRQSVLSIPCPEPALEFQDSGRRVQLGAHRASWGVAVDEINDASWSPWYSCSDARQRGHRSQLSLGNK